MIDERIEHYDGLVKETAAQLVASGVELEFDDLRQLLWIKAWRALVAFDGRSDHMPTRDRTGRTPRERFVFGCLVNFRKDIEKRPRRYAASIDALRADALTLDAFDARYLSVGHDQVFGDVDEGDITLPSSLTGLERQVVQLRLEGRLLFEVDRELGLSRAQREKVMQSVRAKLADWHPNPAAQPRSAPMLPLPHADPQSTPARAAQAA